MPQWTTLKWIKLRIVLISVFFVLFLTLILFRSYQLQISENVRVNNLTAAQYRATVPVNPKRGTIYDRNGQILAIDIQVASVGVHPHHVTDKKNVAAILSKELGLPLANVEKILASTKKFTWVERRIPAQLGSALAAHELVGVVIAPEYRRYYPNKELAGALLGAVGYDAKALGGIELALDAFLKTDTGKLIGQKDAKGRLYTPLKQETVVRDLHLTIDVNLQHIAEKYLAEGAKQFQVKSGFALIGSPKTGEILAVANYPSFNPNRYWKYPQQFWTNHAVLDTFEPGSTFKTIVAAAGLESGKFHPMDLVDCEGGQYRIGKSVIHDHHNYQKLSYNDVIRYSSNIGAAKIGEKIGKQYFYETITNFGFGQKVDLLIPGEENGALLNYKKWTPIDQANHAFGQGIAVTGMQMLSAYMTIANQGIRAKPHIVGKIVDEENGEVLKSNTDQDRRVISATTANDLLSMLESVVENGGTGGRARVEGYHIAGKTGTAQKVDPETKTYHASDYTSSFIGMAPADNPEYVIFVVYDTPKPIHVGGLVAAPIFQGIAKESLAYAGVMPEQVVDETRVAQKESGLITPPSPLLP